MCFITSCYVPSSCGLSTGCFDTASTIETCLNFLDSHSLVYLFPPLQIHMVKEKDATVNPTFIVKPDGGSQGDGIYLIRDPSDLKLMTGSQAKQGVVQEYIQKPLLIDKLKFDIRLYVLIKSLEPLEIYIAKEGLTRFCTELYQVATMVSANCAVKP